MERVVSQEIWPWQQSGFPWPHLKIFYSPEMLTLDGGETLERWHLAYETWGNPEGEPVVIFHALTGDSHVAAHDQTDSPGWWDGVVGEGMALDPAFYHILSFNVLGGSMGSTGPASRCRDGRPWGSRFPRLTLFDMARAAHALVQAWRPGDALIRLLGGSMGGMLAYAYASLYPEDVLALMAIGAPIQHHPWAIAYHTVGRTAITGDPAFRGGDYYEGPFPEEGLALARMADMISYQHPESMGLKFSRNLQAPSLQEYQISSYLRYQGRKLVRRFDANTYLILTEAMDRFGLSEAHFQCLQKTLVWLVGIESDLLYFPAEIQANYQQLQEAGVPVRLDWLKGPWGHDTFLVEQATMGKLIRNFLVETPS